MNYKAIIFDMDGTIIDTEKIWAQANYMLLASKGVLYTPELEEELAPQVHGLALHKSCALIKQVAKLEDPLEQLIYEKSAIAMGLYRQGITFVEGFIEFHTKVLACDLRTGIATNADAETVRITNDVLKLERYFGEHIYSISSIGNIHKPNPDIYIHAAMKLGIDPSECIAIEDSAHGIKAAKAAGMHCIGINTARNRNNLKESDFIIDAYDEIDLQEMLKARK